MDCTTLQKANIHPTKLYRGRFELRGETVSISHNAGQHWYYLDRQQTDEITMIKIWDSKDVAGHSEFFFCLFFCLFFCTG